MTKLFVLFCLAQDGESADMNCLVFWAHFQNGKILTKRQVYNKGISPILGIFSQYGILILLKCAVDSEWNGVISSVVSCSIVEIFLHESHQRVFLQSTFNGLKLLQNISTTVHAMTKLLLLLCLAQDGESTDMNGLVF